MSFQRSTQPEERAVHDSAYEASIKKKLEALQDALRELDQMHAEADHRPLSGVESGLQDIRLQVSVLAGSFQEWTAILDQDPLEKQRKRVSHEILKSRYEDQVAKFQRSETQVLARMSDATIIRFKESPEIPKSLYKKAELGDAPGKHTRKHRTSGDHRRSESGTRSVSALSFGSDEHEDMIADDEETMGLLQSGRDFSLLEERHTGLRRIQNQMHQAQQLFSELASLVMYQDESLQTIDGTMKSAANNTELANQELTRSAAIKRRQRQRMLLFGLLAVIVCCCIGVAATRW